MMFNLWPGQGDFQKIIEKYLENNNPKYISWFSSWPYENGKEIGNLPEDDEDDE